MITLGILSILNNFFLISFTIFSPWFLSSSLNDVLIVLSNNNRDSFSDNSDNGLTGTLIILLLSSVCSLISTSNCVVNIILICGTIRKSFILLSDQLSRNKIKVSFNIIEFILVIQYSSLSFSAAPCSSPCSCVGGGVFVCFCLHFNNSVYKVS